MQERPPIFVEKTACTVGLFPLLEGWLGNRKSDLIRRWTIPTRSVVGRDNIVIGLPGYQIQKGVRRYVSHINNFPVSAAGRGAVVQPVALHVWIGRFVPGYGHRSGCNRGSSERQLSETGKD